MGSKKKSGNKNGNGNNMQANKPNGVVQKQKTPPISTNSSKRNSLSQQNQPDHNSVTTQPLANATLNGQGAPTNAAKGKTKQKNTTGQNAQQNGGIITIEEWKKIVEKQFKEAYKSRNRESNIRKVYEENLIGKHPANLNKMAKIPTMVQIQHQVEAGGRDGKCTALDERLLQWLKEKLNVCKNKTACNCPNHNLERVKQWFHINSHAEGAKVDFARIRSRDFAIGYTFDEKKDDGEPFTEMDRKTFINDCISLLVSNGVVEWESCNGIIPNLTQHYVSKRLDESLERYRKQILLKKGTEADEETLWFRKRVEFFMGLSSFFSKERFKKLKTEFYGKIWNAQHDFFVYYVEKMDLDCFAKPAKFSGEISMQYKVPVDPKIVERVIPWIKGLEALETNIWQAIEAYKCARKLETEYGKTPEEFKAIWTSVMEEKSPILDDMKSGTFRFRISRNLQEDLHKDVFTAMNCLVYAWDIDEVRAKLLGRAAKISGHIRRKIAHLVDKKGEEKQTDNDNLDHLNADQSNSDHSKADEEEKKEQIYDICECKDNDCPFVKPKVDQNEIQAIQDTETLDKLGKAMNSCCSSENRKIIKELKERMRWFADWPREDCEAQAPRNFTREHTIIYPDTFEEMWHITTLVQIAILYAFNFKDTNRNNMIGKIVEAGKLLSRLNYLLTNSRRQMRAKAGRAFGGGGAPKEEWSMKKTKNGEERCKNIIPGCLEIRNTAMPLLTLKPNLFGEKYISAEKQAKDQMIYINKFSKNAWPHEQKLKEAGVQFDGNYLNMFADDDYGAQVYLIHCPCLLRDLIAALGKLNSNDWIGFDCEFGHTIEKITEDVPGCEVDKLDGKCASLLQIAILENGVKSNIKPVITVYLVMFLKLKRVRTEFALFEQLFKELWESDANKIGFAARGDLLAVRNALYETRICSKKDAFPISFKNVFCLESIARKLEKNGKNPFTLHLASSTSPTSMVQEDNAAGKKLTDLCHSILRKPLSKMKDNNFDDVNLSPRQIKYAAEDAFYTLKAYLKLSERMGFTKQMEKKQFEKYVGESKVLLDNDDESGDKSQVTPPPNQTTVSNIPTSNSFAQLLNDQS